MQIVEELAHANRKIKIYFDPDPINPRKDYDNATIMLHWHPRYDLGDKTINCLTKEELETKFQEDGDPILAVLPLNLYDHSGLSVSTGSFSCQFDSGQIGWVIITKSKNEEMNFGDMPVSQYEDIIKSDVEVYNNYLTGQVYGYEVLGNDNDCLESCWGYIGDIEGCISDAKSVAERSNDPAVERFVQELASRATYAGAT